MKLPTYDELLEYTREKGITTIATWSFFTEHIDVLKNVGWKQELLKQDGMNQLRDFLKDREANICLGIEDFNQLATLFEHLFDRPASTGQDKTYGTFRL